MPAIAIRFGLRQQIPAESSRREATCCPVTSATGSSGERICNTYGHGHLSRVLTGKHLLSTAAGAAATCQGARRLDQLQASRGSQRQSLWRTPAVG